MPGVGYLRVGVCDDVAAFARLNFGFILCDNDGHGARDDRLLRHNARGGADVGFGVGLAAWLVLGDHGRDVDCGATDLVFVGSAYAGFRVVFGVALSGGMAVAWGSVLGRFGPWCGGGQKTGPL